MNPLLDMQGVSKSFRGLRAVADFSMRVDGGAIVALIGPNGAGKTTVFDMVSGAACVGTITVGSATVLHCGRPAARVTSQVTGANPATGVPVATVIGPPCCPTVLIGG